MYLSCLGAHRAAAVALVFLFLFCPALAFADNWDQWGSYYSILDGTETGATLKTDLRTAMTTGHIQRTYGDFRFSAAIHDQDPNNPNNILLVYNRASVPATWDGGVTWNREHVWPQSLQPGDATNSSTGNLGDPHALLPANPGINSARGNKPFGFENTTGSHGHQGSYYFPGDLDKGDIARNLFYSDTRWSSLGLSLTDAFPGTNQMGDLSSIVAWNYLDVPDEFERRRNHTIYSQAYNPTYYTNNRNAYVDHPEFVWSVYVDQLNDSQLSVGTVDGNGASNLDVDYGTVFVGAAAPTPQNVQLNKTGQDGTYFGVSTSGGATSSIMGNYNAFAINASGTDSRSLTVGLNATTAAAGAFSGQVTINNLDVTTGFGDGHGAQDDNDTIDLSLTVVDRSEGSFASGSDLNTLVYDFGSIARGSGDEFFSFDIHNLVDTLGFTAALDVIAGTATGDTSAITTDFAETNGIAAGSSANFSAILSDEDAGVFSATYTFRVFDDRTINGFLEGTLLTLELTGEVTGMIGDLNNDGFVDIFDVGIVSNHWDESGSPGIPGDANDDGVVDIWDVGVISDNWFPDDGGAAAVPEPSTLALMGLAVVGLVIAGRRQRRTAA